MTAFYRAGPVYRTWSEELLIDAVVGYPFQSFQPEARILSSDARL